MRRRILLWMGFCLLFISFFHLREGQAQEANQIQTDSPFSSLSEQLDVTREDQRSFTQRGDSSLNSESNPTASTKKSIKPQKSAKSKPKKNAIYTVKKGDTLARIAIKTRVSVAELRDLNHMKGNALQIGQILALQKEPNQGKMPLPTAEQATNALSGELEEEEDDGVSGIVTWAEIERKNKESSAPLDHWSTPEEPKLLVKVAMGFLGAPYRFGGSSVTASTAPPLSKRSIRYSISRSPGRHTNSPMSVCASGEVTWLRATCFFSIREGPSVMSESTSATMSLSTPPQGNEVSGLTI
jgi:LysM repeat protein